MATLLSPLAGPLSDDNAESSDDDSEYDDEDSDSAALRKFAEEFGKFFKKYPSEAVEAKISQEQGITFSGKQMLFDYIEDGFQILDAYDET